jgi:hypothetical protein
MVRYYWYINRDPQVDIEERSSGGYPTTRVSENDIIRSENQPVNKYYISETVSGFTHTLRGSAQNRFESTENTYGSVGRITAIMNTITTKLLDTYNKMVSDGVKKKMEAERQAMAAKMAASSRDRDDEMQRLAYEAQHRNVFLRKKQPSISKALRSKSNVMLPLNITSSTIILSKKARKKSAKRK